MKILVKLEYLALLLFSLYLYIFVFEFSLLLLVVLLFVPDLSMIGYLLGNSAGAISYNIVHNVVFSTVLLLFGLHFKSDLLISLSLIFFIHIFMDRTIGYGLKYLDNFKHTHLGWL